jgi:acetyl esterase/lipase
MRFRVITIAVAALAITLLFGIISHTQITKADNSTKPTTTFVISKAHRVYVYAKKANLQGAKKLPLVIFMHGTGGDPQTEAIKAGWVAKAKHSKMIVISPSYNDYATYDNVPYITRVIRYAQKHYPVDAHRIYSVGFSNGGATSIALASSHPKLLAGIAAYGWANDLRRTGHSYLIPFQFISGTREATEYTASGKPMVRVDIRTAIKTLFRYNKMPQASIKPNYGQTPYWGYKPDATSTKRVNGTNWQINNYQKRGYSKPFAQFIMISEAEHTQHRAEADYTWQFLKHFSRNKAGHLFEK